MIIQQRKVFERMIIQQRKVFERTFIPDKNLGSIPFNILRKDFVFILSPLSGKCQISPK